MTPAERDAVRASAQAFGEIDGLDELLGPAAIEAIEAMARAVLAFVPPSTALTPPMMRVFYDGQIKIYDHRERRGPTLILDAADAERLAWALLAQVALARTAAAAAKDSP